MSRRSSLQKHFVTVMMLFCSFFLLYLPCVCQARVVEVELGNDAELHLKASSSGFKVERANGKGLLEEGVKAGDELAAVNGHELSGLPLDGILKATGGTYVLPIINAETHRIVKFAKIEILSLGASTGTFFTGPGREEQVEKSASPTLQMETITTTYHAKKDTEATVEEGMRVLVIEKNHPWMLVYVSSGRERVCKSRVDTSICRSWKRWF